MKNFILGVLLGSSVTGAAAFFIHKKKVADIRADYEEALTTLRMAHRSQCEKCKTEDASEQETAKIKKNEEEDAPVDFNKTTEKVDYTAYFNHDNSDNPMIPSKKENNMTLSELIKSGEDPTPQYSGDVKTHPRTIGPDSYGEIEEYDQLQYTLYSDGVVADEDFVKLSDSKIESRIGKENLNKFGEYDKYAIYIQNDELKLYIEIISDSESYEEVMNRIAARSSKYAEKYFKDDPDEDEEEDDELE